VLAVISQFVSKRSSTPERPDQMEINDLLRKRQEEGTVWGLLTGSFRIKPATSKSWDVDETSNETQPIEADEIIRDETLRVLGRAGLPSRAFELKLMPLTTRNQEFSRRAGVEEWVIYIRVTMWVEGAHLALVYLEQQLQTQLKGTGLTVRAVYWRVVAEAAKDYRPK
jgi:hypothetical protein